jgi:ATP-dependent exoDNAse (exonuclease V) beta subunit
VSSAATPPFVIYNASAGSGKTHTLVRSFLFRLLDSNQPEQLRRLLAITFTNKAAQEMKSRILGHLASFASSTKQAKADSMFLEIADMCGLTYDQLHQRSKKAYRYILHHFGQLQVATIDKLTHKIIRTFARDLGINARFEVALDGKSFMAEVVEQVLSKTGEDKALTQVLVNYVLQKSDDLKSWDVTKELNSIAHMYLNENHMQSLAELEAVPIKDFVELDQKLKTQIETIQSPIQGESKAILRAFEDAQIPASLFPYESLPKLLKQLAEGEWPKEMLSTTLSKSIESGMFLKKSASDQEQDTFDSIQGRVTALLETYTKYWRQLVLLQLLRRNVVPLSLMQHIGQGVSALQNERNNQLLGFFNKLISDAIKDTDTHFMFERLGVRFQHFFVDEFQDTSSLQWANLHPLFSHALEDSERQGSLVLVGDAKQSIYRWRGGYPEQFMALTNKEVPFTITPEVESLPKNFRSLPNIVSFNNDFFTKASAFLPLKSQQELYATSCNQEANSKSGGYVTISTVEGKNNEERMAAYQAQVLARVKNCLEQGYALQDICVLVRKNKQGVQIAKVLTEAGIQITSSESLLVSQSPEVQFLINLVKLRVAPKSKINRYTILEHFALLQPNPFEWTIQQIQHPLRQVLLSLSNQKFDLNTFNQLPIYAALEYAVWALSLTTHVTAHIQAFLDEVLKWQGSREGTPIELISHWELNKDNWTVRPPENRNAVKIMTTHKAKGLAFPVVILPFSDSKWIEGNNHLAWFPLPEGAYAPFKEMLLPISQNLSKLGEGAKQTYETYYAQSFMDTINTLYVGMTRPIEELHIITQKGSTETTPKGLPDIFAQAIPELKDQEVTYGIRSKQASKTTGLIEMTTPFTFNLAQATSVVAERSVQSTEALFGTVLHEVMALVDVPQDLERALSQSNAKERLGTTQYDQLYESVQEIVVHEQLAAFFDPANTPYNERALFAANGELLRPDRFVITREKNVLLLDYKTGQQSENHANQLEEYATCLKHQGLNVKQKLLVYCEKNLILKEL